MKRLLLAAAALLGFAVSAQNISVTLGDGNVTYDGTDYWYEADVYIGTTGGLADFFVGSGQLYFNYNTEAFGTNIKDSGGFVTTQPYNSGEYFLGQEAPGLVVTPYYKDFVINNNTSSRISWSFQQGVSSGAMNEMITATPRKLVHVAFKFIDETKPANVSLHNDESVLNDGNDQFFTACGPYDSASTNLDCDVSNTEPRNKNTQIQDAGIDDTEALDTTKPVLTLDGSNPLVITQGDSYTDPGATSDDGFPVTVGGDTVDTNVIGDYTVTYNVTDLAGNVADQITRVVSVEASLSTDTFTNELEVAVYPNPVVDTLYINADFDIASLYDLNGAVVAKTTSKELNVSNIAGGVYLLEVIAENGQATVKVIKK